MELFPGFLSRPRSETILFILFPSCYPGYQSHNQRNGKLRESRMIATEEIRMEKDSEEKFEKNATLTFVTFSIVLSDAVKSA